MSGLSGFGGVLAKTGVSAATSVTSTVAVNAIQYAGDWDGFVDSLNSIEDWQGCISSTVGSFVTNGLGAFNSYDSNGIALSKNVFNTDSIGKLNSLAGGLASTAVTFGLTGEATFNVLNIADFGANASSGLFEVSFNKDKGLSARLGTGGVDLSFKNVKSAISGLKAVNTNIQINKVAKQSNMNNVATALRVQYGFGDETQLSNLDSILKGQSVIKAGNGAGEAQTITENGKRTIYLNNYKENMTREEKLAMGITIGHEAYRDGIVSDAQSQFTETANAVLGHTVMAKKMQNDDMYNNIMTGIINTNQTLKKDIAAFDQAIISGDWSEFGKYVGKNYDYSADYWRVLANGDFYDDGLDDRVSFEDGRETIYYSKRSKQGTLEKFLGLDAGTGYSLLLKDAGYSWTQGTGWVVDENNPDRVISYENIKNLINDGTVINNYYNESTPERIRYNSKIKEINDKYGYPQERQELKEKQAAVIANPNYQQGSQGPFGFTGATADTTWCNMATQEVTFETSYNLSMALRNENDLYCVNTNANAMYDNLMKAALDPNSSIVEITPQQAQALANMGYTVAGTWKNSNPDLSGHIATVEAGHEYKPETGPYFGNVGTSRYTGTGQKAIDAFGPAIYQSIKYYYDKDQFKNRRWY